MSISFTRKVALALLSSVVSLLLLELLLALFHASFAPPPLYPGDAEPVHDQTSDPFIGWKMPPSTVVSGTTADYTVSYTSNSLGFRATRDLDAASISAPIVFLGDSYTFGSGVKDDETFVSLVELKLGGAPCLNMGIGAFGVDQMWMTLRHYALPLEPRAVVLSFIVNDLDRSLSVYRFGGVWREKPTFCLDHGGLVPLTAANSPSGLCRFVERHSRLVALWRKAENSISKDYPIGYRWRLNRAIFQAIRDDCAHAGVPLLVLHIPVNRRHPVPMLKPEFAKMGIPFEDLTDQLSPDADSLYYPRDHHLNAAGHRWVAQHVHRLLLGCGLMGGVTVQQSHCRRVPGCGNASRVATIRTTEGS
jgi:hypothetical protein